jgi:hypothetical protein
MVGTIVLARHAGLVHHSSLVLGNEWKEDRPWRGLIHAFSVSNQIAKP